jgi:hypothetical protein
VKSCGFPSSVNVGLLENNAYHYFWFLPFMASMADLTIG